MKVKKTATFSNNLITLLTKVKSFVNLRYDILLNKRFKDTKDVLTLIDSYIVKIQAMEWNILPEIEMMFAPTSFLQDLAIDNGWGDEFIEIASQFDDLMANFTTSAP